MSPQTKKTMLLTFLVNAVYWVLVSLVLMTGGNGIEPGLFLVAMGLLGILIQGIASVIFAIGEKRRDTGRGMLLGLGIFLLIGFAVCSSLVFMS